MVLYYKIAYTRLIQTKKNQKIVFSRSDGGIPLSIPYPLNRLGGDPAAGSPTAALL